MILHSEHLEKGTEDVRACLFAGNKIIVSRRGRIKKLKKMTECLESTAFGSGSFSFVYLAKI